MFALKHSWENILNLIKTQFIILFKKGINMQNKYPLLKQINNDAYNALLTCGGLILTGPTGTNVNDVSVALVYPKNK